MKKNSGDIGNIDLARSPKFLAMLSRAESDVKAGRIIPAQEFWKKVKRSDKRPQRKSASKIRP